MARILSGGGKQGGKATPPPLGRRGFSGNFINGLTRAGGAISRGSVRRLWARDPESGIQAANLDDIANIKLETKSTLTTAMSGTNNDMKFTAKPGQGSDGDDIRVRVVVAGASTALSVAVSTKDITINSATNGASAATTTAAQAIAAVKASAPASALVDVELASGNDGTGVIAAFAYTNLAGGADPIRRDNITPEEGFQSPPSPAQSGQYTQTAVPEVRGKQRVIARNTNRRLRKR